MPRKNHRWIALWLFACCAMVYAMAVVGGITRLTESGLSITEWKPVSGILPPLSEKEWNVELEKYKTTPQYIRDNFDINMEGFKRIYWVEFMHRLLGRLTGFIFLMPFLAFLISGSLSLSFTLKLLGLFVLGGAQGAIGWYMVQSGLIDVPAVSQYRLALHFFMALALFSLLFWLALDVATNASALLQKERKKIRHCNNGGMVSLGITILIFIQMIAGAFLAGLDGGLVYNTFPLMDGRLIPGGLWVMEPLWRNVFENVTLIQFLHRVGALLLLVMIAFVLFSAATVKDALLRCAIHAQLVIVCIQFFLGVATLLSHVSLPLASLHQATALALLGVSLFINHHFRAMNAKGEEA